MKRRAGAMSGLAVVLAACPAMGLTVEDEPIVTRPEYGVAAESAVAGDADAPAGAPQAYGTRPSTDPSPAPVAPSPATPAVATEAATAAPPARRDINPYDRDIELTVPLNFNSRVLGELPVLLTRDDRFFVQSAGFVALLEPLLTPEAQTELAGRLAGIESFAPEEINATGISLDYDPEQLSVMVLRIDPGKRTIESLFRGGRAEDPEQPPEPFSAYLNTNLALQRRESTGDIRPPSIFLNGAVRFGNVVFEGDVQGREDFFTREYEVERRYARFVYDQPEDFRRWYLGDLDPETRGRQGFVEMGGLGVSRQRRRFDSFRSGVLSGNRVLTLQDSSTIRVLRNGAFVREFRLDPGQYDVGNLPLEIGSNDIELEIVNDIGQTQYLNYSAYLDAIDLEPGDYEYGAYLGLTNEGVFGSPDYDDGELAFTGFYRKAFENRPAIGFGVQATADVQGLMGQTQLILANGARVRFDAAASTAEVGTGFAGAIGLDHVVTFGDRADAWTVVVDYTSEDFATIGNPFGENPNAWAFTGSYSRTFNTRLSGNLTGSYRLSRSDTVADSYNINLTANYRFHPQWSAQAGVEYLEFGGDQFDGGGFGFTFALIWQPRYDRRAEARYQSTTNSGSVRYSQSASSRVGAIGYSVGANYSDGPGNVSGQVDYVGNRFDATLSHTALGRSFETITDEQVTTLRIGSSIATTGRKVAVGRNIFDSFAILYPHESLDGRSVITGQSLEYGQYNSRSDWFGPALNNQLSAYVNQSIRYDVIDAPLGYNIGDGVVRVHPSYRSGYQIEVGSDAYVSALGTLVGNGARPLALVSGRIRDAEAPESETQLFFTNSVGRFAAQDLRPGRRYRVELLTSPPTGFEFTVPADSDGLLDLKTVAVPITVAEDE